MCRSAWVALGIAIGSLAFPAGKVVGLILFHRSVLYPRKA